MIKRLHIRIQRSLNLHLRVERITNLWVSQRPPIMQEGIFDDTFDTTFN